MHFKLNRTSANSNVCQYGQEKKIRSFLGITEEVRDEFGHLKNGIRTFQRKLVVIYRLIQWHAYIWIWWHFYVMLIILISERGTCTFVYALSKRTHQQTSMNWTWWWPLLQLEPTQRTSPRFSITRVWLQMKMRWRMLEVFYFITTTQRYLILYMSLHIFCFNTSTLWIKAVGQYKWQYYFRTAYILLPHFYSIKHM